MLFFWVFIPFSAYYVTRYVARFLRIFSFFQSFIVRQPVPAFTANALVKGGEFKKISTEDMKGKYSVLFFYPLDLYVIIMMCALLL